MRDQAKMLERIMGQLDNADENTAMIAFRKAREIMSANGLTFHGIYELSIKAALSEDPAERGAAAAKPGGGDQVPEPTAQNPYLHQRVAGRFARTHEGKRVIRGTQPPTGTRGRLRVIRDVEAYPGMGSGLRKVTMSLETEHEIYEPFDSVRSDKEWMRTIRECSITGAPVRFT
jgi:hypothetical protein